MTENTAPKIMNLFLENNIQLSRDALDEILKNEEPFSYSEDLLKTSKREGRLFINLEQLKKGIIKPVIEVIKNFDQTYKISDVQDMSAYFQARLNYFKNNLQKRLQSVVSINNAKRAGREEISLIAIVSGKRTTKSGNVMFSLEDFSGEMRAIATKEKLIKEADKIVNDDVLGFTGNMSNGIFFINEFTWPDMPIHNNQKTKGDDATAAFISDVHIGSREFEAKKFQKMIDWINGDLDSHTELHPHLSEKLKYIFIAGDLVDGVGVYPGQEDDLIIKDIYKQYKEAAKILEQIPERIKIVISPGNHDYVRLAQPQPPVSKETAPDLYDLPNVDMISNPGLIKAGSGSESTNILIYHGTSIDKMVMSDPNLKDGYKKPGKVMAALMKRRHLCPLFEGDIMPQPNHGDPLVIPEDIDVLHMGHVHSNDIVDYRGVTLINSGTWQAKTSFQEFLGHEPTPARLPLLNLKTNQITLTQF
ncbi:MAG: metallophosphoesterase [Candidatus Undinarchaeales archaeon]